MLCAYLPEPCVACSRSVPQKGETRGPKIRTQTFGASLLRLLALDRLKSLQSTNAAVWSRTLMMPCLARLAGRARHKTDADGRSFRVT